MEFTVQLNHINHKIRNKFNKNAQPRLEQISTPKRFGNCYQIHPKIYKTTL